MPIDPNSSDARTDPDIGFVATAGMSVTTTGMEGDWDSIPGEWDSQLRWLERRIGFVSQFFSGG